MPLVCDLDWPDEAALCYGQKNPDLLKAYCLKQAVSTALTATSVLGAHGCDLNRVRCHYARRGVAEGRSICTREEVRAFETATPPRLRAAPLPAARPRAASKLLENPPRLGWVSWTRTQLRRFLPTATVTRQTGRVRHRRSTHPSAVNYSLRGAPLRRIDLMCFAYRYHDLRQRYCRAQGPLSWRILNESSACNWKLLQWHWEQRGAQEQRFMGCTRLERIQALLYSTQPTKRPRDNRNAAAETRVLLELMHWKRQNRSFGQRCQAAVATPYNVTPGGGEAYLLQTAATFQRIGCRVTLLLRHHHQCMNRCLDRTAQMLGVALDTTAIRTVVLPFAGLRRGRDAARRGVIDFDIFFLLGNSKSPPMPGLGRLNLYMCQFPFDWMQQLYTTQEINLGTYDHVLLNSNYSLQWYKTSLEAQLQRPCAPLPLIVYPPVALPQSRRATHTFVTRPMRIVVVGRLFEGLQQKGHFIAVRAFAQLLSLANLSANASFAEQLELYIVGSVVSGHEAYADQVATLADRLGISGVHCEFDVQRERVEELIEGARVVWSLTGFGQMREVKEPADAEHFGIAVAEAMGAGCIPVLLNAGALPEHVPSGAVGRVAASVDQISLLTLGVLSLPQAQQLEMSLAARHAAARFTGDRFHHRLRNLVHKGHLTAFWSGLKRQVCKQSFQLQHLDRPTERPDVWRRRKKGVALIVETRPDWVFATAVMANLRYLPAELSWRLRVAHGSENAEFVRAALTHVQPVEFWDLGVDSIRESDYNALLKTPSFWSSMQADYCLVFQTDGLLLRPVPMRMFGWDWVGAPWHPHNDAYKGVNEEKLPIPSLDRRYRVGNGGLSIRSVPAMADVCQKHSNESADKEQEDIFLVKNLHLHGYQVADLQSAAEFALEVPVPDAPVDTTTLVGIHQSWLFNPPRRAPPARPGSPRTRIAPADPQPPLQGRRHAVAANLRRVRGLALEHLECSRYLDSRGSLFFRRANKTWRRAS